MGFACVSLGAILSAENQDIEPGMQFTLDCAEVQSVQEEVLRKGDPDDLCDDSFAELGYNLDAILMKTAARIDWLVDISCCDE